MFQKRLAGLIAQNGINMNKLSSATDISSGLIHYYVKGEKKPSLENLIKISKYFRVSSDYLLGLSNEKDEKPAFNAANVNNSAVRHREPLSLPLSPPPSSDEEAELLRIFSLLGVRRRHKLLNLAFSLEEELEKEKKSERAQGRQK